MTIERTEPTGKTGQGVSCPLCGKSEVHYSKETDTWMCEHCEYTWYTIGRCTNRWYPET